MNSPDEDNFDDIDLDELFNDFNDKQSRQPLVNSDLNNNSKVNEDDLTEFNESDCTAPRKVRKRPSRLKSKQTTMYDYASSISYRHKQFYSSLDNTTTAKTIMKGQKRRLSKDDQSPSTVSKRLKAEDNEENLPSLTPPDLIDNLLKYLDERSRTTREEPSTKESETTRKKTKTIILDF